MTRVTFGALAKAVDPMKITFSNLGMIKRTTLDLAPLTVIIGPNNSGKTYLAYATYRAFHTDEEWGPPAASPSYLVSRKGFVGIPIDERFDDLVAQAVHGRVEQLGRELGKFFQDSSGKLFQKTELGLNVEPNEVRAAVEDALRLWPFSSSISFKNGVVSIPLANENGSHGGSYLVWRFMLLVYQVLLPRTLLLPAERNAFIITYKMLANRRYKLLKDAQREIFAKRSITKGQLDLLREQGEVRYPRPVEDFLDFLTDVELSAEPLPHDKNPFQVHKS